jgi:hypothetical protein
MFRDANGQRAGQPISAAFDPLPDPERNLMPAAEVAAQLRKGSIC